MKKYAFSDFKAAIDGKAAVTILNETRRIKRKLEIAFAKGPLDDDGDTKRVLDFCNYLQDTLELPPNLSPEDWAFYKRTMEKLVERRTMPRYVLDVFEEGLTN